MIHNLMILFGLVSMVSIVTNSISLDFNGKRICSLGGLE